MDHVEVDVQSTRDGRSVMVHDSTLDRTTNGKGPVNRLTLSEIKHLRILDGQEIPNDGGCPRMLPKPSRLGSGIESEGFGRIDRADRQQQ